MKRFQWIAVISAIILSLLTGLYVGRSFHGTAASEPGTSSAAPSPKILYYRNPMGLPDTSAVPKKDSMGMDYVPVYEGGEAPSVPGTVVLTPEKIQKLGVRTARAELVQLSSTVRASAEVRFDETRQYAIAPKFQGWVERLHADETGMQVRRGAALLTVYSPALLAAQEEYRVADQAAKKLADSDPDSASTMRRLRDASRERLKNWDIDAAQLANVQKGRAGNLIIKSPANAVVTEKLIVQGMSFAAGETILRLADLSTVWLIAHLPASDADRVEVGQRANFASPTVSGRSFEGRVTFVQPVINSETRTLEVRIELPNPDGALRPGLFGDVELTREASDPVIVVPRSAVLDSGSRQIVLIEIGGGRYEPRAVHVGERAGASVEILDGLEVGESVAVSANFLIDAESNLQAALEDMSTKADEPASDRSNMSDSSESPGDEQHKSEHIDHAPRPASSTGGGQSSRSHDSASESPIAVESATTARDEPSRTDGMEGMDHSSMKGMNHSSHQTDPVSDSPNDDSHPGEH